MATNTAGCKGCAECECKSVEPDALELSMSMFATKEDYLQARIANQDATIESLEKSLNAAYRKISALESERVEIARRALEAAANICDEMEEHYSAYKDTALLNNDVELSIAASGEPRAARFIGDRIRAITPQSILEGMKK